MQNQPASAARPVTSVVVTYQPDATVVGNVRRLLPQSAEVVVVDNASSGEPAALVAELEKMPGVKVIRNDANLGIATAMNIGIQHALRSGASWVATFDQDTGVPPDFFETLLGTCDQCRESEKVGMIVPGGWIEAGSLKNKREADPLRWSFAMAALSSGCLVKADVLERIGLYDDDFFIDYVDVEFCLRLQKRGLKILSADSVVLEHELGHKQTRVFCGFQVSFRIHAAWRYYYIFRNRILVFRRFFNMRPRWFLRDGIGMCLEFGRIIFLEYGRRQKIRAALSGIRDGLLGRSGRHPLYPGRST